jgi:GT2 family glycosyltransferase
MKLSIVILNWNGRLLLKKFLPNIILYTPNTPIYVVDNASEDDSIKFLKKEYKQIILIKLNRNIGYSKAYNHALKIIDSDVYCIINNDVMVTRNWTSPIMSYFQNEEVDIAQPLVLDFNKKNKFEYAGAAGGFIDKFGYPFCRGRIFSKIENNNGQYDDSINIFWASGACMFVNKITWNSLGGFDEDFFMHQEEIDFCWRAIKLKKNVMCISNSKVYHVGSGSKLSSNDKIYYNHRNSLLSLVKNIDKKNLPIVLLIRSIFELITIFFYLFKGKVSKSFMVIKGYLNFIKLFPKFYRKRDKINSIKYYKRFSIIIDSYIYRKNKFSDF